MNREQVGGTEEERRPGPARSYLALSGTADADPRLVRRLLSADWARRLLYNAAIDPRVPFAEGVTYHIERSSAEREGRDPPAPPERSAVFLPVPRPFDLNQDLTRLRERHGELRRWPATMLRIAIEQGCTARARHVADCAKAKEEGRKLPRLHFRRAGEDIDVSTESLRMSRCGDGAAVTKPKRRSKAKSEARRRQAEARNARADEAWAKKRRDNGMREARVLAGLRERAERRERQRVAQTERDRRAAAEPVRNAKLPRRDSPAATIGANRVRVEVQGLGKFRIRLSRPIPDGAEVVRLHLVKLAGHGHRVEARLVVTVPAPDLDHDEFTTGAAIHAVVSRLPADASPLDAVEAVEAAGIPVRGDDWNVSAPSADHVGRRTRPVKISKQELKRLAGLQEKLARRDAEQLAEARRKKAVAAEKPKATEEPQAKRARLTRSRSSQKLVAQIKRIGVDLANRAETRACQDARRLVTDVALVASDPQAMGPRLMRKGGPAERRAEVAAAKASGLSPSVPAEALRPPRGYCLTPAQRRAMRRNMHAGRPAFRVRRLNMLCTAAGVIHAVPGNAYTSQTCPRCVAVEPKALGERIHRCRHCGLSMHRDRAAALVTLGKALLAYREGPDPGGREAARRAAVAEALAKAERRMESRAKGGRKTGAARRNKAGASPAGGAYAPSLQGVVPLCPGLPGRNIGERPTGNTGRISN